jgi:hypothetical protein
MALLAYNITGSPVTLTGITPALVLPASASPPTRGAAVNVTSHVQGLSGGQLTALAAQQSGTFVLVWTSEPEFTIGSLVAETVATAAGYTPAVSGNWSPAPTQISSALDQLAARSAAAVPYTPGVSGNWNPVPTDVGPALDQLAANAIAKSYVHADGGQSATMATGDHLILTNAVIFQQGSRITLDVATSYSSSPGVASRGRFTLTGGHLYRLTANPVYVAGGTLIYQWYDSTNQAWLGIPGDSAINMTNAVALVKPTGNILVEVQFRTASGVTQIGNNNPIYSWAMVEELP